MHLHLLALALAAGSALAGPRSNLTQTCGFVLPAENIAPTTDKIHAVPPAKNNKVQATKNHTRASIDKKVLPRAETTSKDRSIITIDTYIHVLARPAENPNKLEKEYLLNNTALDTQMKAMDKAFEPAGIKFKDKGRTWNMTEELKPVEEGLDNELFTSNLFKSLRRPGGRAALHIYFMRMDKKGAHGTSEMNHTQERVSGIIINVHTIPGGTDGNETFQGITAVHEAGHWLGFDTHTPVPVWQCTDGVVGCPSRRECRNYMSYTPDKCRTEFDADQIDMFREYAPRLARNNRPQPWTQHKLKLSPRWVDRLPDDDVAIKAIKEECQPPSEKNETKYGVLEEECIKEGKNFWNVASDGYHRWPPEWIPGVISGGLEDKFKPGKTPAEPEPEPAKPSEF